MSLLGVESSETDENSDCTCGIHGGRAGWRDLSIGVFRVLLGWFILELDLRTRLFAFSVAKSRSWLVSR